MKRKNLFTVLLCTACLTISSIAPMTAMAEEETEAVTEAAEAETEAEEEVLLYPDYTASDYVTLGEYKGLEITRETAEVTDDEVNSQVESDIQMAGALETITEGTVEEGDIANIDYEGKKDDVAFDGGTAKGYDLEIGSNTFIDGFESGLIGVAIGDTVDLNLTFPENYGSEELAGEDVVFTVTVNEVQRMPELTDDLVNTITEGEYTDTESYLASVREELMATKESSLESSMQSELLTMVANNSTVNDYPQELLDYGVANMREYYEMYASMYGMEFADFISTYLGMTEDEFNEQALLAVKESVGQDMYVKAIAEAEGLELSDEEYQQGAQELVDSYGYESIEAMEEAYGKTLLETTILQKVVLNFLLDNANITEPETEMETELAAETETVTEAVTEAETEA